MRDVEVLIPWHVQESSKTFPGIFLRRRDGDCSCEAEMVPFGPPVQPETVKNEQARKQTKWFNIESNS